MRLRLPGLVVLSTLVFAATAPEFAFAQPAPSSPGGAMLTSSPAWTVPRTPWGHPDLEGVWATDTITPFERPVDLAGKEFFSEQEAAEFERQTLALMDQSAFVGGSAVFKAVAAGYPSPSYAWRFNGELP